MQKSLQRVPDSAMTLSIMSLSDMLMRLRGFTTGQESKVTPDTIILLVFNMKSTSIITQISTE